MGNGIGRSLNRRLSGQTVQSGHQIERKHPFGCSATGNGEALTRAGRCELLSVIQSMENPQGRLPGSASAAFRLSASQYRRHLPRRIEHILRRAIDLASDDQPFARQQ